MTHLPGHSIYYQTYKCNDLACVDYIVSEAHKSNNVSNIQVFKIEDYSVLPGSGNSVFPPVEELWYQ